MVKVLIEVSDEMYLACVNNDEFHQDRVTLAAAVRNGKRINDPHMVPIANVEFSKEQLQEIVRQAIQKYIDSGTVETRACLDCKYYNTDPNEEPCRCCCYGDGLDNFEERDD